MRVYLRKMFPHDITHEVSVRWDIVQEFFDGKTEGLVFEGKKSEKRGMVTINSATDPRFGGDFKSLLLDEGRANVNDIVMIYKDEKNKNHYLLEIVKPSDDRYFSYMVMFRGKDRHAFLKID